MYYRVPYCCSTSKGCVHTIGAWFDANTPQSTPQSAVTIVFFQELCRRHTVYHSPTGHDRAVNLCRGCGCCVYVCGGMLLNVHVVHAVISFVPERVPSAHSENRQQRWRGTRNTKHNTQTLASAAATKANEDAATAPKTAPITSFRDVGNSAASRRPPCPVAVIMCRDCRARTAGEEGAAENADAPPTRVAITTEPRIEQGRC